MVVRSFRLRAGMVNTEFNIKRKKSFGASTFSDCRVSGKKWSFFLLLFTSETLGRDREWRKDAPRSPSGKSPSIAEFHRWIDLIRLYQHFCCCFRDRLIKDIKDAVGVLHFCFKDAHDSSVIKSFLLFLFLYFYWLKMSALAGNT